MIENKPRSRPPRTAHQILTSLARSDLGDEVAREIALRRQIHQDEVTIRQLRDELRILEDRTMRLREALGSNH